MTLRIIDSEFGVGAGDRLGRIEKMYHRVGSDLIREDDHCGGISRLFDVICKLWQMLCDPMIGLMIRLPTEGFLVIAHIASNGFFFCIMTCFQVMTSSRKSIQGVAGWRLGMWRISRQSPLFMMSRTARHG